MLDFLYSIDVFLFRLVNQSISNPIFDKLFLLITDVKSWLIAYIIIWFVLLLKGGRMGKISAVGIIILIVVTDQLSSALLKNVFERLRPCHVLEDINLLVSCKKSFSFPSSHAVNNFAVAFFFGNLFKKYKSLLIAVAVFVALSRVYIGIHYPSDIIAGALIGGSIGYLFSLLAQRVELFFISKSEKNKHD